MTWLGIEPATFRLLAEYLNKLCYRMAPNKMDSSHIIFGILCLSLALSLHNKYTENFMHQMVVLLVEKSGIIVSQRFWLRL
jgi:hypothetical protein